MTHTILIFASLIFVALMVVVLAIAAYIAIVQAARATSAHAQQTDKIAALDADLLYAESLIRRLLAEREPNRKSALECAEHVPRDARECTASSSQEQADADISALRWRLSSFPKRASSGQSAP